MILNSKVLQCVPIKRSMYETLNGVVKPNSSHERLWLCKSKDWTRYVVLRVVIKESRRGI